MGYLKRYGMGADDAPLSTTLNEISASAPADVRALQVELNRFAGVGGADAELNSGQNLSSLFAGHLQTNGVLDRETVDRAVQVAMRYAFKLVERGMPQAPAIAQAPSMVMATPDQKAAWVIKNLSMLIGTIRGFANTSGLPGAGGTVPWGVVAAAVVVSGLLLFGRRKR